MQRPSTNLRRVIELARDPDVAPRRLLAAIEQEPGLTDSIIRYVSAFYGRRARTADLSRAVQMLGVMSVAHVAAVHAVSNALSRADLPTNVSQALWSDCVRRALAARRVARLTHQAHPDFAFAVGLCLELGIVELMERHGHFIQWMCDVRPLTGPARVAAERDLFGEDHVAAFQRISREWGLAPALTRAVVNHHDDAGGDHQVAGSSGHALVFWADRLGEALSSGDIQQDLQRWSFGFGRTFEMSTEDTLDLAGWVLEGTEAAASAIGGDAGTQSTLDELVSNEAGDVAVTVDDVRAYANELEEEVKGLRRRIGELEVEVASVGDRDAVTNLPGHGGCLAKLAEMIPASRVDRSGVFVVLVDLDGFSALNARYGYEQGDVMLARVAGALRSVLRGSDYLARVGGDTFGILVAGEARAGRLTAERARAAVEALRLDSGHRRLRITASVAGVGLDEVGRDAGPGYLLASAFRTLHDYRGAGGNRVWWYGAATGRNRRVG